MTTAFIEDALKPALDAVERGWRNTWRIAFAQKSKTGGEGALVIVGNRSQDKFFSNGTVLFVDDDVAYTNLTSLLPLLRT